MVVDSSSMYFIQVNIVHFHCLLIFLDVTLGCKIIAVWMLLLIDNEPICAAGGIEFSSAFHMSEPCGGSIIQGEASVGVVPVNCLNSFRTKLAVMWLLSCKHVKELL